MVLEDFAQIPSWKNLIPCICPDDVIFHPDTQLSKHQPSRRRELSVWTLLCVENLRTVPACIISDFSATRLEDLSVRQVERFLSKTQIWEDSCNRPNNVCSRPDAILHKASRAYKIQQSRRQSS
jgi:hypothetical protein